MTIIIKSESSIFRSIPYFSEYKQRLTLWYYGQFCLWFMVGSGLESEKQGINCLCEGWVVVVGGHVQKEMSNKSSPKKIFLRKVSVLINKKM